MYGGESWSRTSTVVRRRVYSPLDSPRVQSRQLKDLLSRALDVRMNLSTFISFNETPQSSPKLCFVLWRIPAAFPHNTLNFTRVEHFYKQEYGLPPPCLQAVVYSTNLFLVGDTGFELANLCFPKAALYQTELIAVNNIKHIIENIF